MIDVSEGALQDHCLEIDTLIAENTTFERTKLRSTHTKDQFFGKGKLTQFRVEIANNRSSMLERLNSLQEDIDRLQSYYCRSNNSLQLSSSIHILSMSE